jgi:hypothetical protein
MISHENHYADGATHHSAEKAGLLLKGGLATSGIIIAPYVGDAIGISAKTVPEIMEVMHGHGLGSGIAGSINSLLSNIPYIGETLSSGSMATTAASGIIGIGGILLGNYLEKKHHREDGISWGKIIKYSALTTSILIALPSILTGLSVGLSYLAAFAGSGVIASALTSVAGALGSIGGMNVAAAGAGIGSALTHLITCGGAALSVAGAIYIDKATEPANEPPKIEIIQKTPIKRGEECRIEFKIIDANGTPLTPDELTETYTRKLHVMMVDNSLSDYHHIHPEFNKDSNSFSCSFIPKMQGEYNMWSDFTLQKDSSNPILRNKIEANLDYNIPAVIQHTNSASADGINIEITPSPPLASGKNSNLQFNVTKAGIPVKFEPIMGAYAHLVGFSKDGENFIHCHPLNIENNSSGILQFHVEPRNEGFTKFFLQVKTNGREIMVPFGQYIQPPEKFVQREASSQSMSHQGHVFI